MSQSLIIGHTVEGEHSVHVDLPTLLESKMMVCGNSGAGKSWLFRLIAERAGKRVPTWIIDPESEFATLREKLDIAVVGGGGEIPLTLKSAALTTRRLYELGVSAVFDLSDFDDLDEKRAAVKEIVETVLHVAKKNPAHALLLMVDEAHQFCPQTGEFASSSALKRLADSGRKRWIGPLFATQRVTKLHNDVIAECKNIAIGFTGLPDDQVRAGGLLGLDKEGRQQLGHLPAGSWHAYGPAFALGVHYFKSDQVETTHPNPGQRRLIEVPPASAAIQKIVSQLGDLPAQAQAEEDALAAAQQELGQLRRELQQREHELKTRPTQIQMAPAAVEIREVKVPVLNGELHRLEEAMRQMEQTGNQLLGFGEQLVMVGNQVVTVGGQVVTSAKEVGAALLRFQSQPAPRAVLPARPQPTARPAQRTAPALEGDFQLTAPMQRILDTLALFETLGQGQPHKSNVAVFAGASPKSSAYQNNVGALHTHGLVDYPASSLLALTETGHALANPPQAITTLRDLHNAWFAKLTRPQAAILIRLLEVHPEALAREDLAHRAGASPTSSAYQNNLGALRSLGLIEYRPAGHVVATELLYPEGLA